MSDGGDGARRTTTPRDVRAHLAQFMSRADTIGTSQSPAPRDNSRGAVVVRAGLAAGQQRQQQQQAAALAAAPPARPRSRTPTRAPRQAPVDAEGAEEESQEKQKEPEAGPGRKARARKAPGPPSSRADDWKRAAVYQMRGYQKYHPYAAVAVYFGCTANIQQRREEQTAERKRGDPEDRRCALVRRFWLLNWEFTAYTEAEGRGLPCYSYFHGRLREMVMTAAGVRDSYGGFDTSVAICGGPWLLPAAPSTWPDREQASLRAVLAVIDQETTGREELEGRGRFMMRCHRTTGVDLTNVRRHWPALATVIDQHEHLSWFLHGSARLFASLPQPSRWCFHRRSHIGTGQFFTISMWG